MAFVIKPDGNRRKGKPGDGKFADMQLFPMTFQRDLSHAFQCSLAASNSFK